MTSGVIEIGGLLEWILWAFIAANSGIAGAYLIQCEWRRRNEKGAGHAR